MKQILTSLTILFAIVGSVSAQKFVDKTVDFFNFPLKDSSELSEDQYPPRMVLAPVIGYRPITGFLFGGGAQFIFKPNSALAEDRASRANASFVYTLNNQILFFSKDAIYFDNEKKIVLVDFEARDFPTSFSGLGGDSKEDIDGEIQTKGITADVKFLRRLFGDIYLASGIYYNWGADVEITDIDPEDAALLENPDYVVSEDFKAAGLQFGLYWDPRKTLYNQTNGSYAFVEFDIFDDVASGDVQFKTLETNFRQFWSPFPNRKDVIAAEVYGRFSWGDEIPVTELSTLGGAFRIRGYKDGRYTAKHTVSSQVEYRRGLIEGIGATAFFGVGEVFEEVDDIDASIIKYSAGAGLRVMMDKRERLNIRLDYGFGFGQEFASGFYVAIQETF